MAHRSAIKTSLVRSIHVRLTKTIIKHGFRSLPTRAAFCLQSIVDNKVQGMEKLCMSCVQLALHRWQLLPRVHTGCGAHKPLLHLFHQVSAFRAYFPVPKKRQST